MISREELHQLSVNVSLLKDFGITLNDDFYSRLTSLVLHKDGHISNH